MTSKKVLIIGGGGQLGSIVFKMLISNQVKANAIRKSDLDLTHLSSIYSTLEMFKPNIIINCAAYTAVDNAETEREVCRRRCHELVSVCSEYLCGREQ